MKIYKDPQLKEETAVLDFGIVLAGEKKEYTFYILNDSFSAILQNLSFKISHPEIKIVESPKELGKQESGKITIEWVPTITLKAPLRTKMEIDGFELYK